jgi:hypothetical protein
MDEEHPDTTARSVIIRYKVWERSGLDRDILKQTVRINGQPFAIVGGYDAAQRHEAHRAVLEKLRSTPGIESVAEASVLPFGDYSFGEDVQRGGPRLRNEDPDAAGRLLRVQSYTVTSGLLQDARFEDGAGP